jgi:hypothetical protein
VIQTIAFGSLFLGLVMFSVWGIKSLLRFIRALLWLPQLKKGILLDGILIDCINQAEYRRHPGLQTTYQFKSPVGRELTRRQFYRRDDLLNEQLPEPGTPVKILYASDNCYVML